MREHRHVSLKQTYFTAVYPIYLYKCFINGKKFSIPIPIQQKNNPSQVPVTELYSWYPLVSCCFQELQLGGDHEHIMPSDARIAKLQQLVASGLELGS